jgi:oxygen-independent coproporphyrinogen-3 oxidase
MAGIYFHIPFCKTRCVYCDFFSSIHTKEKENYVEAMCRELHARKDYLNNQTIETVYIGGGTPSLLTAGDFEKIFNALQVSFDFSSPPKMEITLEANPDDITPKYLSSIRHLPFNRISLGVQSFDDNELKFLNRRHSAQTAIRAVEWCEEYGYGNISIDLMYGLSGQTLKIWEKNIQQAIRLNIQHLSAYHLVYEEGTQWFERLTSGRIQPIDEETSVWMFERLIDLLTDAGFEQYEISNFARPGYYSRHNSSYWDGSPYLGIGASAHSYNGISRQWNPKISGASYLEYPPEVEIPDACMAYNDFIITRLRTMKGICPEELRSLFGEEKEKYCLQQVQKHLRNGLLEIRNNRLALTRKGIFLSDGIMCDLMCSNK